MYWLHNPGEGNRFAISKEEQKLSKYSAAGTFQYGDKRTLRKVKNTSFVSFRVDCLEVMHPIAVIKTSTVHFTCLHTAMLNSRVKIIKAYYIILYMLTFQVAYNKINLFILFFYRTKHNALFFVSVWLSICFKNFLNLLPNWTNLREHWVLSMMIHLTYTKILEWSFRENP